MTNELPLLERLRQMEGEGYMFAKLCIEEIEQLRGNLSLAEERLANAMQQIERLRRERNVFEIDVQRAERISDHLGEQNERLRAGIRNHIDGYQAYDYYCDVQEMRDLLAGSAHEPGAIPGEVVKCYACGQVRGYILDVQKSTGLLKEIEDAQRTTTEMPQDLSRSLGLKSGEQLCNCGEFCAIGLYGNPANGGKCRRDIVRPAECVCGDPSLPGTHCTDGPCHQ